MKLQEAAQILLRNKLIDKADQVTDYMGYSPQYANNVRYRHRNHLTDNGLLRLIGLTALDGADEAHQQFVREASNLVKLICRPQRMRL